MDGTGKYLTAGIIDEHSHIAISRGGNEGTQESSAEVRINQAPDAVPVLQGTQGETVIYVLPLPPKPDDLTEEQISSWLEGRCL